MDEQYQEEEQAGSQPDGAFARVNGGMLQSNRFLEQIVSLVGNVTAHNALKTADGSEVTIVTEHLDVSETGSLMVDPNRAVEIMGQATGPTELTAFIWRDLGSDMDLGLYNKMIEMQHQNKYKQYFGQFAGQ